MATRLEELIESIDPSRTIDRVSAAVDDAFNSFQYNNPIGHLMITRSTWQGLLST